MSKGKDFICKNKKILIFAAILIIFLLMVGIYLILRSNDDADKQAVSKVKKEIVTSKEETGTELQEEGNEKEDQESQQEMFQEHTDAQEESRLPDTGPSEFQDTTNANSDSYSDNSVGTESANNSHTHVWKEHTAQKWVSNIVTVVDQPEQNIKYSIYRMYWYTTGTWEETRDAERFNTWYHSEEGGLYPLYHPYKEPEDNPLFIEYDKNGNPTYINDHVIAGPYYETIPAVTHEEDHGHYETYVDYYYCDCGATK